MYALGSTILRKYEITKVFFVAIKVLRGKSFCLKNLKLVLHIYLPQKRCKKGIIKLFLTTN